MKSVITVLVMIMLINLFGCRKPDDPQNTGMPDPHIIRVHDSVGRVIMVYGTDEIKITLYKPYDARFEVTPTVSENAGRRVSLAGNSQKWRADIGGILCTEDPIAEYYFNRALQNAEEYEYYRQEVTDLGMEFMGRPVKYIKSAYKKAGDKNIYESHFTGFEFVDTLEGEPIGKGLMGFKMYAPESWVSLNCCKRLFAGLFYPEQ